MPRTKVCTRCGLALPLAQFRGSPVHRVSRICEACRAIPRHSTRYRRPPMHALVAAVDDGLSPLERARHDQRLLAAAIVASQLD